MIARGAYIAGWRRRSLWSVCDLARLQRKKPLEKLNTMHNNRIKRGLVSSPEEWLWSSWRFYFLQDASILEIDRVR